MTNWIVSNDAGGAEVLSAWAKQQPMTFKFILTGPAVAVFQRRFPDLESLSFPALESAQKSDFILTSTSWASDMEKRAVALAKQKGIKVASLLDHWVNYPGRFRWNNALQLPDEIWVADEDAERIAQVDFPAAKLVRIENLYLKEVREEIQRLRAAALGSPHGIRILYACEAISEAHGRTDQPEFRAIGRFLDWLGHQTPSVEIDSIRFRLHPAEAQEKYTNFIKTLPLKNIELSAGQSLAEDCAWADWVVGMSSMALVVGLAAGKKVLSCMPSKEDVCPLPQKGIFRI